MTSSPELALLRRPLGAAAWLRAQRDLLAWWAASRAVVLGGALFLYLVHRPRGYFGARVLEQPLGALGAWDGRWYTSVAAHGYLYVPGRQSDPAFFPLYPIALRALHALGLPWLAAGALLSNLAFLAALAVFAALGTEIVGPADARRAARLLAVTPIGYVCSLVYPEALVLLLMAAAALCAFRGRWLGAAACAAAAALGRPEGALLALPLAALAASRWRVLDADARARAVTAALAGPATVVSFTAYLGWALGDPFAWSRAERAWGRSFRPDGLLRALEHLPQAFASDGWLARDAAFCVLYLALLAVAARRGVPWPWIAFGALIVVLPTFSGSFESDARFGMLALPVYWGAAALTRRRALERAVLGSCLVLLAAAIVTIPLTFP